MSLLLDQRRKSMLKAMGVELWWVPTAPVPAPTLVPAVHSPQEAIPAKPPTDRQIDPAPAARPVEMPAAQTEPERGVVQRVAPEAAAIHASKTRPSPAVAGSSPAAQWQCQRAVPVFADGAEAATGQSNWLFITDDFGGMGDDSLAAEQLFHNMLRAMRLFQRPNVWHSQMRQSPPQVDAADAQVADGASLEELVQITQPKVIVLMGRIAAQALLQSTQPLGVLRQAQHLLCQTPVVATYSPSYLLRASHAKAGAWVDLRRALQLAHG